MSVLEPNVRIINLDDSIRNERRRTLRLNNNSDPLALGHSFQAVDNNEIFWNNGNDKSNSAQNHQYGGTLKRTDFYTNINNLLNQSYKDSVSLSVPEPNRSQSISVSPRLFEQRSLTPGQATLRSKSNLYKSPIDIFSMGKIQEFREKVNGGRVAMPEKDIWKCLFAEFLGTFLLVLVGCGSATGFPEKIGEGGKQIPETAITPSLVAVSFCFALMVSTLAATIGHISAHLNPAVTIAFFVTGKIQLVKAVLYVIFQCVAAIVAIAFLQVLCPDPDPKFQYGYVELANKFTPVQGVGIEFFITFVLVFVICAFCDENRNDNIGAGPLAIGFALAAVIFFGGPLTGAGINPARVLGPCVILGKYTNHWIYWVGPIGGAIAAAVTYHFIFRVKDHEETKASDVDRRDRTDAQQRKDNGVAPEV